MKKIILRYLDPTQNSYETKEIQISSDSPVSSLKPKIAEQIPNYDEYFFILEDKSFPPSIIDETKILSSISDKSEINILLKKDLLQLKL